jgi:hypothetical protein
VFRPHPERGQTLADVMRAEAAFVKEIGRLHPKSPKPIIVGNCQGGWATMVLAAAEIGEGVHKRFRVSFAERRVSDILKIDENDRSEETDFPTTGCAETSMRR